MLRLLSDGGLLSGGGPFVRSLRPSQDGRGIIDLIRMIMAAGGADGARLAQEALSAVQKAAPRQTALHLAVRHGHADIVAALLAAGAEVNATQQEVCLRGARQRRSHGDGSSRKETHVLSRCC